MIGSIRFIRPVLNIILCSSLLGCASSGFYAPPGSELTQLPPAPLGIAEAGDRTFFANGRRERVTAVNDGLIDIRRSSTYQYLRYQDFTLNEKTVKSSNGVTDAEIVDLNPKASLWPLQAGKRVKFGVVKTRGEEPRGDAANPGIFWECSVDGMQTVTVITGEFDTYRIECVRKNSRNKIKQYVTRFYAPAIQQVVLRIDRYPYKPTKRVELVAFQPALTLLSRASARRYKQHFQNTLETVASGTTTSWWSRRSDTRIHTTPTNTRKLGSDLYCRNYLVKVNSKGSLRSGAGLVCRDDKGQWRVPRKIDTDKGELTF